MNSYTQGNSAKHKSRTGPGRSTPFYALTAGVLLLSTALAGETNRPAVMIYEVCVKPDRVSGPRWVKLRSFSGSDVNLKGYSLHDRTNCFYRFDKDCLIKAGRSFVLYFYPKGISGLSDAGLLYSGSDSLHPYCAKIAYSCPFSGRSEPTDWYGRSDLGCEKASEGRLQDSLTMEQFDYVSRLADEHRKRYGITNVATSVIAANMMASWFRESDEVVLLDSNGKIVSFVGWGDGAHLQQSATSRWEKAAIETGLVFEREHIGPVHSTDNIFSYPHVILERTGPDSRSFRRVAFGSPMDTQCKDPIQRLTLSIDKESGLVRCAINVRSSYEPWQCVLEIAAKSNFSEILIRKAWDKRFVGSESDEVEFTDDDIRTLCKHDTWFYRARRQFNDGDSGNWTEDVKVVVRDQWLSGFGDTPRTMAENLIEARQKSKALGAAPLAK